MLPKLILYLTLTAVFAFANDSGPQVTIKQGTIKGKYLTTKNGKTISAFTGIPYAQPPVGELRFKSAIPAKAWEDTLDATKPHAVCPQHNYPIGDTVIGDEDCLYLNVYSPKVTDDGLLPVIFYIHDGGFLRGNANDYGPQFLVAKDVVLVTANYRLGPLGFLVSGTMHALGNEGLKDQVFVLKWIKKNIEMFGGDPKSITVAGNGAGGVSAHLHMLSPLSKGLINGVIAQSGTALAIWAVMPAFLNARWGKFIAGDLGCDTYYVEKMMDCLMKAEAHEIIRATETLYEFGTEPSIQFRPTVEPAVSEAFLSEHPDDIITSGKYADVPLLTGFNTEEGDLYAELLYKHEETFNSFAANFTDYALNILFVANDVAYKYRYVITKAIRKFYFGDMPIDGSTKAEVSMLLGDLFVLSGEDLTVQLHSKHSKKPIHYYIFGYEGSNSVCNLVSNSSEKFGVCHGDEKYYLFNSEEELREADEKVSEFMSTLWTNFVKFGNPTPDSDALVKWEPTEDKNQKYYFIKSETDVAMSEGLYADRIEFWRNLKTNLEEKEKHDEL